MEKSFNLINKLSTFLKDLNMLWCVSGGWAIDLYLDKNTRDRCDLDISIFYPNHINCIEFFLDNNWRIEGKLNNGFKTIQNISDYDNNIHYFWSFPKNVTFISEYTDNNGNRRISYNRKIQHNLDYIEVFFDQIENGYYVYRKDKKIKRIINKAIIKKNNINYLAPEIVLLYKSGSLSDKNITDFNVVISSLSIEQKKWLKKSLISIYNDHKWIKSL